MVSDWEVLVHSQQKSQTLLGKDEGTGGFGLKETGRGLLLRVLCSNCLISLVSLGLHAAHVVFFAAQCTASCCFRDTCDSFVIDSCK